MAITSATDPIRPGTGGVEQKAIGHFGPINKDEAMDALLLSLLSSLYHGIGKEMFLTRM